MIAPARQTSPFDPLALVSRLQALLPAQKVYPLHEPRFAGHEWDYVKDCIDTGWVSSVGAYVDRFEAQLAARLGVRHAVAVSNGTAALHVALILAGVGANDEVLVPALTFIATANAVQYCGAVPHFVDSDWTGLGLDPGKLDRHLGQIAERRNGATYNRQTGRRIAAIVPMHVFGHPVDMDALLDVARRWDIACVEDAAEAVGSTYKGRPAGSLAAISAISFNGNKIITSGGGAILTNDPALARHAKHLTTTAKVPHAWTFEHDETGFNYRMPNLNAALGCAQLEQLDGFIAAKRRLAALYQRSLSGLPGIEFVAEPAGCESIYWLNAIKVPDAEARDAVLAAAHAAGLLLRPAWGLMNRQPMYRDCPHDDLSVAEALAARLVCLPSGVSLAPKA